MELNEIMKEFEKGIKNDVRNIDKIADETSKCIPVNTVKPSSYEGEQTETERYITLGKIISYIMENKYAAGIEFYEDDEADTLTIVDLHEHDLLEYGRKNNII